MKNNHIISKSNATRDLSLVGIVSKVNLHALQCVPLAELICPSFVPLFEAQFRLLRVMVATLHYQDISTVMKFVAEMRLIHKVSYESFSTCLDAD